MTLNSASKYDTTHVVKTLLENGARVVDLSSEELKELEFVKQLHEVSAPC